MMRNCASCRYGEWEVWAAQWSTLLAVTSLTIPTVLIIWRLAPALNLLQLGEEEAHYLGVDVRTIQRILLLCSALLVASAVAVSGVIGFIGLVIPFNTYVARLRPSGRYSGFRAGGRVFIADCRHPGPYGGCACGDAGRSVDQSSRRTVVFMAYFSSARSAWLNISSLKGFTIT
jgi:hypothetical protein